MHLISAWVRRAATNLPSLSGMELKGQSQKDDQGGDTEMESKTCIQRITSIYNV